MKIGTHLQTEYAQGSEVFKLVQAIKEVLDGQPSHMILLSCLSLVVVMQQPEISADHLQKALLAISQHIALYLTSLEDGESLPKEMVN